MANLLIHDSLSLGLELLKENRSFFSPFSEGEKIFWRDEKESISYQQLKEDSLSNYAYLHSLKNDLKSYQLIIETKGVKNFAQILGGLMAQAEIYLVLDAEKCQNNFTNPLFLKACSNPGHSFKNAEEEEGIPSLRLGKLFFQTSGSTSTPQWISFSGEELITTAFFQNELLKEKNLQVYALVLPWHHVAGFMVLWRAFILSKMVISKDVGDLFPFDSISLIPYQFKKMFADSKGREQLLKCKAILLGGDHISQDLKEAALCANLPVYISYGLTETLGYVLLYTLLDKKSLYTPGFRLTKAQDNEILIVNNQGKIISTGDIVEINGEGIRICGRKKFSFKFHGEWINPEVIESLAQGNPKVINALCLSGPGPLLFLATEAKNKEEWEAIKKEVELTFLNSNLRYYPKIINPWPWHIPLPTKKKNKELRQQMANFKEIIDSKNDFFLLFGGTFSNDQDWDEVKASLPSASFIIPPIPYCSKDKGMDSWAKSLSKKEILDIFIFSYSFLGQTPCHFIGYSLGGRITLEIYHKEKGFFKSLILISAHPGLNNLLEKRQRIETDEQILLEIEDENQLKTFFDNWYRLPIFGQLPTKDYYQNLIKKRCQIDNFHYWLDYWKKVIKIFSLGCQDIILPQSVPVLYLCGENDTKYCELSRLFKKFNSQTKIAILKDCGHALLEEAGLTLAKEIRSFLILFETNRPRS